MRCWATASALIDVVSIRQNTLLHLNTSSSQYCDVMVSAAMCLGTVVLSFVFVAVALGVCTVWLLR
jgi:hypothetical protein